jgi:predicted DNA-binding transcriptional regulator YafY
LRAAIDEGAALRIGYASSNGSTVEHMIDPVRVNAGQVTAYDHRGGDVRTFTISRIAGVEVIDPGSLPTTEQV